MVGWDSIIGIATCYGLDGLGIQSRWGCDIFRICPDRPWGPPSLLYNGYRVSFAEYSGWGVAVTTHHYLVRVKERLQLYLYSPSGPSWLVLG